jgi:integrase
MRPGELCRLEWRHIDWATNEIDIRATKTDDDRCIALAPPARVELERIVRRRDQVFHTAYDKTMSQRSYGFYWTQVRAVFEAEVPRDHWLAVRLRRDPKAHLAFYELRHACGSYLASRGLSAWDISNHLGNSARVCEAVYVHPYKSAIRDRVRGVFEGSALTDETSRMRETS